MGARKTKQQRLKTTEVGGRAAMLEKKKMERTILLRQVQKMRTSAVTELRKRRLQTAGFIAKRRMMQAVLRNTRAGYRAIAGKIRLTRSLEHTLDNLKSRRTRYSEASGRIR